MKSIHSVVPSALLLLKEACTAAETMLWILLFSAHIALLVFTVKIYRPKNVER